MSSTLTYKGLVARIDFSAEDEAFIGRIAGIDDDIAFRGTSVTGLVGAFHEAADGYLATCATLGKKPGKAHSGKIMLRVDPAIHTQVALAAELAGKSLNQWAEEVLRAAVSNQVHPDLASEPQPAAPSNPTPKVAKVLKLKPATEPGFLPKASPPKTLTIMEMLAQRQTKKG